MIYSIILKNGMTMNVEADLEWPTDSHIIRLTKDDIVIGVFNADNIAGLVNADYKVEADYRPTRLDASMLFREEKQEECEKMLSDLDLSMGYVLESDHRSFTNPETEDGWLFDKILDWRKAIQPYIIKEE